MRYEANDHDVFVSLTDDEFHAAREFGGRLYDLSQGRGLQDHRTFVRKGVDGRRVQELGSIAECAVAKACGIEWTRWFDTFKAPDLGHNIEVRLIGVNHYGLRIYDRDDDSRRVVGVVIEKGKEREPYRIAGWINAKFGKRPEYLIDPLGRNRPVYAVPQQKLFRFDELLKLLCPRSSIGSSV